MHYFGQNDPFHFGSMAMSLWTLFEMCTLDVSPEPPVSVTHSAHSRTLELGESTVYQHVWL
jgi:hypothetical protein